MEETKVTLDKAGDYIIDTLNLSKNADWIIQVFIIVLIVLSASLIAKILLNRLYTKAQKSKNSWDDALIDSVRKPLHYLIWVIGLGFAADIIYGETGAAIFSGVAPVRDIGVIILIGWTLLRFIDRFKDNIIEHRIERGKTVDHTTADAIAKVLKASVIITIFLVGLQTLGFSIEGVLAFGGVGGIAVGFAAKDMLANFFGAMIIYLDRPFNVGDWINSPEKEIEGIVEKIGWRQTLIRTFDKRPLYVPNSLFTSIVVCNPSRMLNRRIYETIGIRYDDLDKMGPITDEVRDYLKNNEEIDQNLIIMVNFNEFAASSINFFVYCLTVTRDWQEYHRVKHDVLLKIADIIDRHGAEIAFPTRTLHLPDTMKVETQAA